MQRALAGIALLLVVSAAAGCGKKGEVSSEILGSYARDTGPRSPRAELSVGRGGMALTVVRASASADLGVFESLFAKKGAAIANGGASMGGSAGLDRVAVLARTFKSVECDGAMCRFELSAEGGQEPCSGSFEKVQNTLVVIAPGACQAYSGRWALLEGAVAPTATAPSPTPRPSAPSPSDGDGKAAPPAPTGAGALDFPPDVPAPKDHMSCLQACSIVDTRCHRTAPMGREAFLGCVEKHQICDAKCEEVFPFFGR
ncbi:MAG: hypothetical protein JNL38_08905 [Myxococcales bacterium]|nr:hypothetical protein [Myxococcales bacterium]